MSKVYEIITEKIIKALENGTVPWQKPWKGTKINYISRKSYRGINLLLLERPGEYLTWNQIKKMGGSVKKGSSSEIIVYYKTLKKIEEEKDPVTNEVKEVEKSIPLLRYYRVFHLDDVKGIDSKLVFNENVNPLEEGEKIIDGYIDKLNKLDIRTSDSAFYRPSEDLVVIPKLEQYNIPAEYYSTAFHELAHSTGHSSRLNRFNGLNTSIFGSESYSKEELIAEISACMLCSIAGIDTSNTFNNSASYIASWLKVLKNDKKLIVQASNEAQKAVDFILNGEIIDYKESA